MIRRNAQVRLADAWLLRVTLSYMTSPAGTHTHVDTHYGFNDLDTVFPECEECSVLIGRQVHMLKGKALGGAR